MKRLSVRLSDETHKALEQLCYDFGTRKSEVVRNALIHFMVMSKENK